VSVSAAILGAAAGAAVCVGFTLLRRGCELRDQELSAEELELWASRLREAAVANGLLHEPTLDRLGCHQACVDGRRVELRIVPPFRWADNETGVALEIWPRAGHAGDAGGAFAVLARAVRVCGGCLVDAGVLWSGGARVPRLVVRPRRVLSECSWGSETPPDAEKPVHTREPMVHGSRVGQRLGFFVI